MQAAFSAFPVAASTDPKPLRYAVDTLALVALAACVLLVALGRYPLWDPDESRHAEIARQMAEQGRWIVPILDGVPYHDKPAPFYWLVRACYAALGVSELAARLPSVIATLASLAMLHRFALPRVGRKAAALGGLIYLTAPEVVALGRFCNFDAVLSFFVVASILAWLAWSESGTGAPWLAYAAMGCGTLIKGPIAIALPMLVMLACGLSEGRLPQLIRGARPIAGGLLVAAITWPWFTAAAFQDPGYVFTFLVRHNLLRYVSESADHARGAAYYLPALAAGLFPWTLLLPAALCRPDRGGALDVGEAGSRSPIELRLLVWAGTVVTFFSLGRGKLATYVLPALPALALWLGSRLSRLEGVGPDRRVEGWLRLAIVVWATTLLLAPFAARWYVNLRFPQLRPALAATWLLPVIGALGLACVWRARRRALVLPIVLSASNLAVILIFYTTVAPVVSLAASDQAIARAAIRLAPHIPMIRFRVDAVSLSFYTRRSVPRIDWEQWVVAAASRRALLIVSKPRHGEVLRKLGLTLHEWYATPFHTLYSNLPLPPPRGNSDVTAQAAPPPRTAERDSREGVR